MKHLIYIAIAFIIISCVGNSTTRPIAADTSDTTSTVVITGADDSTAVTDSNYINLSQQQADSIIFRLTHHYSLNFNFLVKSDSLTLIPREGDIIIDTCVVHAGDIVAVADIKVVPGDSIDSVWVKVASNQMTMGWLPEHDLLRGATPDDAISEIIDMLSDSRIVWMSVLAMLGIIGLFMRRKRENISIKNLHNLSFLDDMNSPYPYTFLIMTAVLASLYASIQNFTPEFWQEYYFHPTLNPLVLPPFMATLVIMAWMLVITFIAVIDEVYHHFYFLPGITYIAKLVGLSMLVYLIISWSTLIYIGYLMLLLTVIWFGRKAIVSFFAK